MANTRSTYTATTSSAAASSLSSSSSSSPYNYTQCQSDHHSLRLQLKHLENRLPLPQPPPAAATTHLIDPSQLPTIIAQCVQHQYPHLANLEERKARRIARSHLQSAADIALSDTLERLDTSDIPPPREQDNNMSSSSVPLRHPPSSSFTPMDCSVNEVVDENMRRPPSPGHLPANFGADKVVNENMPEEVRGCIAEIIDARAQIDRINPPTPVEHRTHWYWQELQRLSSSGQQLASNMKKLRNALEQENDAQQDLQKACNDMNLNAATRAMLQAKAAELRSPFFDPEPPPNLPPLLMQQFHHYKSELEDVRRAYDKENIPPHQRTEHHLTTLLTMEQADYKFKLKERVLKSLLEHELEHQRALSKCIENFQAANNPKLDARQLQRWRELVEPLQAPFYSVPGSAAAAAAAAGGGGVADPIPNVEQEMLHPPPQQHPQQQQQQPQMQSQAVKVKMESGAAASSPASSSAPSSAWYPSGSGYINRGPELQALAHAGYTNHQLNRQIIEQMPPMAVKVKTESGASSSSAAASSASTSSSYLKLSPEQQQLADMGWTNHELNYHLLIQYNNDIQKVIERLVDENKQLAALSAKAAASSASSSSSSSAQAAATPSTPAAAAASSAATSLTKYKCTLPPNSPNPLIRKLSILEICGFRPFEYQFRTSAVNHLKSLLRDKLNISPQELNQMLQHQSRYHTQTGLQEWQTRIQFRNFKTDFPSNPNGQWYSGKTESTEAACNEAMTLLKQHQEYKHLFLRTLPDEHDSNPISAVRNYLRDRSCYVGFILEETFPIDEPGEKVECRLYWGKQLIGVGNGFDRVQAKTEASICVLKKWREAMEAMKTATFQQLKQVAGEWLQI